MKTDKVRGKQKSLTKSEIFERSIRALVITNQLIDNIDISKLSKDQFFMYDSLLMELDNIIKSVQNSDGTFKFKNNRV